MSEVKHMEAKKIALAVEEKLNTFMNKLCAGRGSEFFSRTEHAAVPVGRIEYAGCIYTMHLVVTREKSESCQTTGSKTS